MAPTGMKRPATGGLESAKKRVKPVATALADMEEYPGSMLASCLEFSLGVFADQRSEQQKQVVAFVGEALASIEKGLEEDVKVSDEKTKDVYADKEARTKEESEKEAALDGLKSALTAAQGAEAEASAAAKAADAALKVVEDEQKTGDTAINEVLAKKKKMEGIQADAYIPLKETSMKEADVKKLVKKLVAVGKEFAFDTSLLESAPSALAKKPEERGDFDKTIIGHMDTQFNKTLESLAEEIQVLSPAKDERAAKVEAAKAAAEAAAATLGEKKAAVKAAKENLKTGEKEVKDATAKVRSWLPDIKVLFDAADEAKVYLKEFQEGALSVYNTLKDMETPPPPPEEEEEEEKPKGSQYKVIAGVRYEKDLLEMAGDEEITMEKAEALWEQAMDGNIVTPTEKRTLRYILKTNSFVGEAKNFLETKMGSSWYQTIEGVQYERSLLALAADAVKPFGQEFAEKLFEAAQDGQGITACEKRTLQYIVAHNDPSPEAKAWLESQISGLSEDVE